MVVSQPRFPPYILENIEGFWKLLWPVFWIQTFCMVLNQLGISFEQFILPEASIKLYSNKTTRRAEKLSSCLHKQFQQIKTNHQISQTATVLKSVETGFRSVAPCMLHHHNWPQFLDSDVWVARTVPSTRKNVVVVVVRPSQVCRWLQWTKCIYDRCFWCALVKSWQNFVWCNQQKTLRLEDVFDPRVFLSSFRRGQATTFVWQVVICCYDWRRFKDTLWSSKIQFLKQGI